MVFNCLPFAKMFYVDSFRGNIYQDWISEMRFVAFAWRFIEFSHSLAIRLNSNLDCFGVLNRFGLDIGVLNELISG